MAMMLNPSAMRQKSVKGMIWSRSVWSTAAPTRGPLIVWMPPMSSMVSASTEVGMPRMVGSIEPRENT